MERREFIKYTSIAAMGLTVLYNINGCGFAERDLRDFASNRTNNNSSIPDYLIQILSLATLSPSSHNTQPWKIKYINPLKIIVCLDTVRCLPAVDPLRRETYLSIGAFIETLAYASVNSGYYSKVTVYNEINSDNEIAEINFEKISIEKNNLSNVYKRRVIRDNYLKTPITNAHMKTLAEQSESIKYFPLGSDVCKTISDLTLKANIAQINRHDAMKELGNWIRWSNEDAEKYKDGLCPASLDIGGIKGLYVRWFYNSESVFTSQFKENSIDKVKEQIANTSGWIVITSNDNTLPSLISTGRLFQSMFLKARDYNIGIQPMSQVLEEKEYSADLPSKIGLNKSIVQFILRAGYVEEYPEPVSLRRPVSSVLSI
ncbi:MAG: nitroreductase [Ignavibacteriae bacterium]|nr:nitroreductase [Ignavibacteriota bacterium]